MLGLTEKIRGITEKTERNPAKLNRYSFGQCCSVFAHDRKNKGLLFRLMAVMICSLPKK